jgi:mono/diheme cytochrome c family protein
LKRSLFVTALALLGACAGQLPPPTEADALRARAQFPGTTVEELTRGRKLYVAHCSGCHALVPPHDKAPDQWPKLLEEMKARAKLKEDTAAEILRYLVVASGAPR